MGRDDFSAPINISGYLEQEQSGMCFLQPEEHRRNKEVRNLPHTVSSVAEIFNFRALHVTDDV